MTRTKKFSAVLAVLVVGFLSIYANDIVFNSQNMTNQQLNVTLNMQSGAQIPVTLQPGQALPTNLGGDQVISLSVNGQTDPVGAKAIMQGPNGNLYIMWNMAGGTPMGISIQSGGQNLIGWPDTGTVS